MRVIRNAEARRTETPAAVMTTLASPSQGAAAQPIWRVDAPAGQAGPLHCIDAEQVWTVLEGGATVTVDGEEIAMGPGDTIVVEANAVRQFAPAEGTGFSAVVTGPAGMRAYMPDSEAHRIDLAWAA